MSDEKFTKIAVGLLTNVRDLVDWGVEGGHTTTDQLRLTVEARKKKAIEFIASGLSQRDTAKALGVSPATINADVQKPNKNVQKLNEPSECDKPHWHPDVEVRWRSSLLLAAEISADMFDNWDVHFRDWRDFSADKKLLSTVRKAANTWQDIVTTLEEKLNG